MARAPASSSNAPSRRDLLVSLRVRERPTADPRQALDRHLMDTVPYERGYRLRALALFGLAVETAALQHGLSVAAFLAATSEGRIAPAQGLPAGVPLASPDRRMSPVSPGGRLTAANDKVATTPPIAMIDEASLEGLAAMGAL